MKLGSVTTSQRGKKRMFKLTSKNSAPKTPQDITKSTTLKIMMEGKEEKKNIPSITTQVSFGFTSWGKLLVEGNKKGFGA